MKREITIVGGGLAGLSLGIALRRAEVPVVLHEASSYPRHRVCGEFLSGIGEGTLKNLGIADLLEPAVKLRHSAWYAGGRMVAEFDLPVPAMGLSRYYLDEALRGRFEELGGRLCLRSRVACETREGQVWCGGRRPDHRSRWVGLKCHLRDFPLDADLEMHAGRSAYAGLAKVEGGEVNLCGLFPKLPSRDGNVLAESLKAAGMTHLCERLERAEIVEDSFCAVAGFRPGWQKMPSGLTALGDSLAMIPPYTGHGMSMAFESAHLACEPLLDYARGRQEWEAVRRGVDARLRRVFFRRMSVAQMMHPVLTSPAGQALFAAAAEKGLIPFRTLYHLVR